VIVPSTERPATPLNTTGPIHVHPHGHVVYVANRAAVTRQDGNTRVFAGGENSIAVFAINPHTGVPRMIQAIDPRGYSVRDFAVDPSGRWLVAGVLNSMWLREGGDLRFVPAGLSLFRIAGDGRLTFIRKVDMPEADARLMWLRLT
jgi:hypothetical protein